MAWDGAMGLVELTGKVVEHTDGYRGQRAGVVRPREPKGGLAFHPVIAD